MNIYKTKAPRLRSGHSIWQTTKKDLLKEGLFLSAKLVEMGGIEPPSKKFLKMYLQVCLDLFKITR